MKEIEKITIPISAEIVLDKKGNVISKKIETQDIPLTNKFVLELIKALGWDIENNQPINQT